MLYKTYYNSLIGKLFIVSDGKNIVGLYIENQKYYPNEIEKNAILKEDLEIFKITKKWLDRYFNKENPKISELSILPEGNEYKRCVWDLLCEIPYGKTTTYGDLAKKVAKKLDKQNMSAQAVGNAVGRNPILIIIPCHRVIGKNGDLIGYAGGIENKKKLLKSEK